MEAHTIKQSGKRAGGRKNNINSDITHDTVRLISKEGQQVGIVSIGEAMQAAEKDGLDLVEIVPDSTPAVCRIMNYGKFLFDEKKKRAESKKKQKQTQVKEVKIRPTTEDNDYQVKLRNLTRFLEHGDKAKVSLRFRGREMAHQELGLEIMQRILTDLEAISMVEQAPKVDGRQIVMVLAPKKH